MAKATKSTKGSKKADKPAREKQPNKNGVTRPRVGGQTAQVWDIADGISSKTRQPAGRAAVLEAAGKKGINGATAATQYGKWRKFNGLEGRTAAPKAAAKKGAKKAGAKKAAAPRKRPAAAASEEQTSQSEE